ncbi:RNA 3'-terminal phosphate cyclase [Stenotrophomonas rhizophila]|jgi:RNA 3'-terminal phosphate cyclase (ATP)|uniref:RNA 3'-terminal phosphate cyclase n=1 Tax=Stenotrophomonas nematodicola TaxID=2656746 RepID=A0ABW7CWW3_9GAMM|nr:RNA 3'-terminal phosphate cyclase [Stenotrophomonas sp. BIGb0135]MCS4236506.1 RNA 3'-terminal phosphate cyclase (ATP) [Stenotrophomonas sp. BIGb0135]
MDMIEIDGSQGGGQLLRSALTLSLCTGIGFTIQDIRARRRRPGLMRQHLTAVNAAARVGSACTHGAELGATALRFEPGPVCAGEYQFATGSAGSATLVLQTVLPALWQADAPSRLRLEGGTHNPLAPSADFIADAYLPALAKMGVQASLQLQQHGFHPAGGGVMQVEVAPCAALQPRVFDARGALASMEAKVLMSGLPGDIGLRELQVLAEKLGVDPHPRHVHAVRPALGPGNVALVHVRHAEHVEVFSGHGERGVSAEQVGARLAGQVRQYLQGSGCVGEYLSDQLLLPMALAGAGAFTTRAISAHLASNARLIEKFLPVEFDWQPHDGGWRVTVSR